MPHEEKENGRSILRLMVPLPAVSVMFLTCLGIAVTGLNMLNELNGRIDTSNSLLQEIKREMVIKDDFRWYTQSVAMMNKENSIPNIDAYFRSGRTLSIATPLPKNMGANL
jgi:hypothetical protein